MFKKPISFVVALLGTTAFCWLAACGSSNKASTNTGTGSATGTGSSTGSGTGTGTGSGTGTGTGTGTGSDASSGPCVGSATSSNAVIDNMSASTITFVPPTCAMKGSWFTFVDDSGTVTPPQGSMFMYMSRPAGFPGAASGDGGSGDAGGPEAACIMGQTASTQYAVAGMGVQLGSVNPPADGGASTSALINASTFNGVEFWLYVPDATTATNLTQQLIIQFFDKQEDPTAGVCDPAGTAGTACGAAGAAATGSAVASTNGAGPLSIGDAGATAFVAGWQLVQVPWASLLVNTYFGGTNETSVDNTTLTKLQFQVQTTAGDASAGISYNFCVAQVQFY